MIIYIEQVLITNFIIDYCILVIISKLIYYKPNHIKICLSALFGSLSSFIIPYCQHVAILNLFKILTSIIMLQMINLHKKQLLLGSFSMFVISYIFGGALLSNLGTQINGGYALSNIKLIYVILTALTFTFITIKILHWCKSKVIHNYNLCEITLTLNNNSITIKSFVDSGNNLCDNNQPVSLINFDTFSKLTNLSLNQYLNNDFKTLINPHFISANTIVGSKKILVFTINQLCFKNKIYDNMQIGVTLNFDNTKEYKAILNSYFCFI